MNDTRQASNRIDSITYRDAEAAFAEAIKTGRLSAEPCTETYAGRYMYMGHDSLDRAMFKHSWTRQYLPHTA